MTWRRSPTSSHSGAAQQHGEALRERAGVGCRDAERGAHRAADAVGGDEVARTDRAAADGADGHAVVAARDGRDLDAALHPHRGQRGEVLLEDPLELVLRHAGGRGRADHGALVGRGVADLDRLAGRGAGERRAWRARATRRRARPSRTCGSRPQERSSSIVAVLAPVARGTSERVARFSTTSVSMPARPSVTAAASPPGPAPTTRTGRLHLIGQHVHDSDRTIDRTCCPVKRLASRP